MLLLSVRRMAKVSPFNRNYELFTHRFMPGITALLALGILDNIQELGLTKPLLEMEHNSAEYLHTLVEALRQVFHLDHKAKLHADSLP